MPNISTISLPSSLPFPGLELQKMLPANHDSLSSMLGLCLAYLRVVHPQRLSSLDESARASAHLISLLLNDPLTQSLLPKVHPAPTAPAKELTALQIRLTSLENTLTNLTKATTEVRKDLKKSPIPPAQPASTPKAQAKGAPPPATSYAAKAASPPRPSVVVDTSAYTWSTTRPTPADLCSTLNAALDHSASTQVRLSAARWTGKGNLVLWGSTSTTAPQLNNALPQLTEVLQTSLSAMAQSAPQSPPTVRHNVKWSRLRINSVPTGVTDTSKAFPPDAVHKALAAENPTYASLIITQKPSWVRNPDTYAPSSASSLSFAFQDPDGTGAQRLLQQRTLFAFGHVATLKKWKETQPKRNKPLVPSKRQTQSRGSGHENPTSESLPPSMYSTAPSASAEGSTTLTPRQKAWQERHARTRHAMANWDDPEARAAALT
jgi:hypothetical protein